MEVSVVVVAHNEERHIARCLDSIFTQEVQPAEVVVVAHNCIDNTETIVRERFPRARLVALAGPRGTVFAHKRGFAEARCEITAHIDGDACARDGRWLSELVTPLKDPGVAAVAGVGIYHGNWFVRLGSQLHFLILHAFKQTVFWSSNFACRKSDYEAVGGLEPLIANHRAGDEWCEDYYLSLKLARRGKVVVAHRSIVDVISKQERVRDSVMRVWRQQGVERRLAALAASVQ